MAEPRHHIKDRMIKTAARLWGLPETETESNFDPLVAMLLGACAEELEKISVDIESTRARVLERLVQLLSPEALTGPLPAHAVACALPSETTALIRPDNQFFAAKRLAEATGGAALWKEFFFAPAAQFSIVKASVVCMIAGRKWYKTGTGGSKETAAITREGAATPPNQLWLAIEAAALPQEALQFYFDMPQQASRQLFFHQLPKAQWYCGQQPLQVRQGYNSNVHTEKTDVSAILHRDISVWHKITRHVLQTYHQQFFTCSGIAAQSEPGFPPELANLFSEKDITALQGKNKLHWICIHFPENIHSEILEQAVVSLNCFPVINSRLHEINTRLQEHINIIPLYSEERFLDLQQVSNSEGKLLHVRHDAGAGNDAGILLRYGGVGRFDARDAVQLVENVLQLVREEMAAFSILGAEGVGAEMTALHQQLNKLEQRLSARHLEKSATPYLVVDHKESGNRDLFVRFWSTNGVAANNIRAGSELQVYRASDISSNTCLLVTTTTGGRDKLGEADKVLAYKTALLSKEKLVTAEDIAAYCRLRLAITGAAIQVKKGTAVLTDERQGFCKTIDVHITLARKDWDALLEKGSISYWQNDLRIAVEQRSGLLTPLRVFIKQQESITENAEA
jgi:hypothetical protein